VTDRGIGIPADQIDQIFEPYYRVPRSDEGAIAGSGLGLAPRGSRRCCWLNNHGPAWFPDGRSRP
jgi:histidine kinase/DNA gyrase B/HSP90-like ATPase